MLNNSYHTSTPTSTAGKLSGTENLFANWQQEMLSKILFAQKQVTFKSACGFTF